MTQKRGVQMSAFSSAVFLKMLVIMPRTPAIGAVA
jgi:hypothetical protein